MGRYLSTIGFSPNLVSRPIIASGISNGDLVEIIRPEQKTETAQNKTEDAINSVRSTLAGAVGNVSLEETVLTDLSFANAVSECSRLIIDGESPTVCLGAGPTDIHIPMVIAATAHQNQISSTMMYSDLDATPTEIEPPALTTDLPGFTSDTFKRVGEAGEEGISLSQLETEGKQSRSTASRHIQSLEDHGFVTTEQRSKAKYATLSPLGEITYRSMKYSG